MGTSDQRPPLVVCDARPVIHLDELDALDLLADFAEFLCIARPMKERELEDRLISRLHSFLLELGGYGFCFVGSNYGVGNREWKSARRTSPP